MTEPNWETFHSFEILELRALRGPNIYTHRPVIYMKLRLNEWEDWSTEKIPGFYKRLRDLLPSLYEHRCSEDGPGGFFHRVEHGTWLGHVTEHIALELQTLADMDTGFGRTRSTRNRGEYHIVFSYIWEPCGLEAGRMAVAITEALARNQPVELEPQLQRLRELREEYMLGPSTRSIVDEAEHRGIPWLRLNEYSLIQLGHGKYQKRIEATITSQTSHIAVEIACDKQSTKSLLDAAGLPVPKGILVSSVEEGDEKGPALGFPLVVKPYDLSKGRGATIGVHDPQSLHKALEKALALSSKAIVEQYIAGRDYRFLVINGRLVAVAQRTPAHVIGDGRHTIRELVDIVNQDPKRGFGHEKVLTRIVLDEMSIEMLRARGYTPDSVPPKGETIYLKTTANLSTGGTATDVTDTVHPDNKLLAERAAKVIGLDVAGIDILAERIDIPIREVNGAIVEVNAAPGFRMHLQPTTGQPRNVATPVVDMLFPPGTQARIPIVAVTGTNGKTTTTRLTAHIFRNMGKIVGTTTTDGIYIGNTLVMEGDCTGPFSANVVLRDPTVEMAILETARGGILRAGLGFDYCDVGVVLNVSADHLGLRDIETVEEMALVKSVVIENISSNGVAILNAENSYSYDLRHRVRRGRVAYFSLNPENKGLRSLIRDGGMATTVEEGYLVIYQGPLRIPIVPVNEIPITFRGSAPFNTENALAAALIAYILDASPEDIRAGLTTFMPSYSHMPGRTNWFFVRNFEVIIDYGHNPAAYEAIASFLNQQKDKQRIGVIGCPGDRRDEDIQNMARLSAQCFDEIIIREDDWKRGRKDGEVARLIYETLRQLNYPQKNMEIITDESQALLTALKRAQPGSLVFAFIDNYKRAYEDLTRFMS